IDSEAGYQLLEVPGGFICDGRRQLTGSPKPKKYPELFYFDASGKQLGTFIIRPLDLDIYGIDDMVLSADSNLLVIGNGGWYTCQGCPLIIDVFITKINLEGDILWVKRFGNNGTEAKTGSRLFKVPDKDEYLVLSSFEDDNDPETEPQGSKGGSDVWIFSIDHEGNTLWEKSFGSSKDDLPTISTIHKDKLILFGKTDGNDFTFSGNNDNKGWWLTEIDFKGDFKSPFYYYNITNSNLRFLLPRNTSNCLIVDDDHFLVAGSIEWVQSRPEGHASDQSYVPDGAILFLGKNNSEHNINIKYFGGSKYDVFSGIHKIDNGIYVTGASSSDDGILQNHQPVELDMWLLKLNLDADTIGMTQALLNDAPVNDHDYIFNLTSLKNGDLLVQGASGNRNNWILRLRANAVGYKDYLKSEALQVYPNPTKNSLFIQQDFNLSETGQVRILSNDGRLVYEQALNTKEERIDVANLEPGVYIVAVAVGDKRYQQLFQKY
ncbi:MAG: T9SS type A sorting domain-containing protein, partial [Luteibaculum sp.]